MEKITGIRSVDFKVSAQGYGVVNWNNSPKLASEEEGSRNPTVNHGMPKLRGYSNIKEYGAKGDAESYRQRESVDFSKVKLYISQNCIRHHLFRGQPYNLQSPRLKTDPEKLIRSFTGLVRGYLIPDKEFKRTSPLLVTDFVDQLGNGNFEQFGRSGSKEKEKTKSGEEKSSTFFSKTTFGETKYEGYGSICIELLQFIPLSADFGRRAMIVDNHKDGQRVAKEIEKHIESFSGNKKVSATYHKEYVRKGTIFDEGEAGILLNEEAIDELVNKTLELMEDLSIRQGKGYMFVDGLEVDYNDGSGRDMMRIKHSPERVKAEKEGEYAVYYERA